MHTNKTLLGVCRKIIAVFCCVQINFVHCARIFQNTLVKNAKIGSTVKVVKLHGEGAVKRRIMDMGLTKGVEVYIRKVAPLGDPIEIMLRGYELSLRKADADMVEIE